MSLFKLRPRFLNMKAALRHRASATRFDTIDVAQKIEEETLSWYSPQDFYPVKIGETFNSRYQVVGKLGYGSYATVWLCRDIPKRKYVAIKVCKRKCFQAIREVQVLKHLNSIKSSHDGSLLVRRLLDSFEIVGSGGRYQCLVHEPLGTGVSYFRSLFPTRRLPEGLLQALIVHVLQALDFLHSEAGVVHADLKESNIILGIEDESVITEFVRTEKAEPCPRKVDGDRIIYLSRDFPVVRNQGRPILCDFGEARLPEHGRDDDIMPFQYRAPEVILGIPWDNKVDIWSVAVLIWDLFEDKNMFHTRGSNNEQSNHHHLSQLVAFLGPPPMALLQRSPVADEYFDERGNLLGNVAAPSASLEESEENLEGSNKELFLAFIRKILQWCPEDRPSAKELLTDAWLTTSI